MVPLSDNPATEHSEGGNEIQSLLNRILSRSNISGERGETNYAKAASDSGHKMPKYVILPSEDFALPGIEFHSFGKGKRPNTFTFKIELSFEIAIQLARVAARLWPLCGAVEEHLKREQEHSKRQEKFRRRKKVQREVSRLAYLRTRHVKCKDECRRILNEIAIAHDVDIETVEIWVRHYKRDYEVRLRLRRNDCIRRRWRQGYPIEEIAKNYRLSSFTVARIVNL